MRVFLKKKKSKRQGGLLWFACNVRAIHTALAFETRVRKIFWHALNQGHPEKNVCTLWNLPKQVVDEQTDGQMCLFLLLARMLLARQSWQK